MKHEAITVSEVGRGVSVENIKPSVKPEETLITGQTANELNVVLEEELLQTENKCCVNPFTCRLRRGSDLQPEKHPHSTSSKLEMNKLDLPGYNKPTGQSTPSLTVTHDAF